MKNKIKCFDNNGKTLDRYTVVYLSEYLYNGNYGSRSMSSHPMSPQGVGMYGEAKLGRHLGVPIKFKELPQECQKLVLSDLGPIKE